MNFLLQIATLAGNLSLKHKNVQFPSDIFLILVTVGATLNIGEYDNMTIETISTIQFCQD
jgi:hypothetical protein